MTEPTKATIRTYSGLLIHLLEPMRNVVLVDDIAHSLSQQCRFTGHTLTHYSVAEHCCRGVYWLGLAGENITHLNPLLRDFIGAGLEEAQRCFLMHDAAETYLGDVASPLKRLPMFDGYRELEARWNECLARRFGLPQGFAELAAVKLLDRMLLHTEQCDVRRNASVDPTLTLNTRIEPWTERRAELTFLGLYRQLFGGGEDSVASDERRAGA